MHDRRTFLSHPLPASALAAAAVEPASLTAAAAGTRSAPAAHGNVQPGKTGEEALITAYIDADSF